MPVLYNAKSFFDRDQSYVITKFDDDMNIESTYTTSLTECDCPAGQRVTCRHRQMLPHFIAMDYADSNWFFCFDDQTWHLPFESIEDEPAEGDLQASASTELQPLPPGEYTGKLVNIDASGVGTIELEDGRELRYQAIPTEAIEGAALVTHPAPSPGEVGTAVVASPGTFRRRV